MAIQESLDKVLSSREQHVIRVALEFLRRNCLTSGVLKVECQCVNYSNDFVSILPDEVNQVITLFGETNNVS